MAYAKICCSIEDDVATIRLNDPEYLNAISVEMLEELSAAVEHVSERSRVLLLTGTGRAFCAGAKLGADLGGVGEDGLPDAGAALDTHINPLMTRLRSLPIPWICAVRGAAAGVGCSFALAADFIMASETAYFLQAFCKIGLVPDGGSSFLLTKAIGRVRAMEMMLLGERLPATRALEWGLINRVVADDHLDAAAEGLARDLARGPTRTLGLIREVAWAAADGGWETSLQTERQLQRLAGRTSDHREGVAAFLDKRPAHFTGA